MGSKMEEQTEKTNSIHSLDRLYNVIASRKNVSADDSYTAQLFAGAPEEPARKLCEEATEVLIEALNDEKEKLASESADLLYHLLVVWAAADLEPLKVWQEIDSRQGISGLVEKQSRQP